MNSEMYPDVSTFNNRLAELVGQFIGKGEGTPRTPKGDNLISRVEQIVRDNGDLLKTEDGDEAVRFIAVARRLSSELGTHCRGLLDVLETAEKTASVSLTQVWEKGQPEPLKENEILDPTVYNQALVDWINTSKVPIKELMLSNDQILKLAPLLTYLDLTDGEMRNNRILHSTFTDEFLEKLLEKAQQLTFLKIKNSMITGSGLAKLNNSQTLQVVHVEWCPSFTSMMPENLPELLSLTITACHRFNQPLPNMSKLNILRMINLMFFNSELPKELPALTDIELNKLFSFDKPLPRMEAIEQFLLVELLKFKQLFNSPIETLMAIARKNYLYIKFQWGRLDNSEKLEIAGKILEAKKPLATIASTSPLGLVDVLDTFEIDHSQFLKQFSSYSEYPFTVALGQIEKLIRRGKLLQPVQEEFLLKAESLKGLRGTISKLPKEVKISILPFLSPEEINNTLSGCAKGELEGWLNDSEEKISLMLEDNTAYSEISWKQMAAIGKLQSKRTFSILLPNLHLLNALQCAVLIPQISERQLISALVEKKLDMQIEILFYATASQKDSWLQGNFLSLSNHRTYISDMKKDNSYRMRGFRECPTVSNYRAVQNE